MSEEAAILRSAAYLECLRYGVVDDGELVETAYARGDDERIRRRLDPRDGTVTYELAVGDGWVPIVCLG